MNNLHTSNIAFIFDLDGTLVKFPAVYSRRYAEIVREVFRDFEVEPEESFIKRIELYGDFEAVIKLIGESWAENFWFKVEQADFALRKELISTGSITTIPGALDALPLLQEMVPGNPLGLVSNTNPSSAFWELWHFGFLPFFSHLYLLNWNFNVPKPDPMGFLACITEYGPVGTLPIIYIGDTEADAEMLRRAMLKYPALDAHMIQIAASSTCPPGVMPVCRVIENLHSLPALVRDLITEYQNR